MSDINLRLATVMIQYYRKANAPLSTFQQSLAQSAVKDALLTVYHLKGTDRCVRCYSKVNVGRVATISPNGNFSNLFPVCMKNILELEAWLRWSKGKSPEEGVPGDQTTL